MTPTRGWFPAISIGRGYVGVPRYGNGLNLVSA